MGTGTTTVAAAKTGRNSIGFEVDEHYFEMAHKRIANETGTLFSKATIEAFKGTEE
jgi:DNA modification methylase